MTERQTFYNAVSNAAWGYFFLTFDINLGRMTILPSFVGYLLLLSSLQKLSQDRQDLALLRPLAVFLATCAIVEWLLSWFGQSLSGSLLFLDLLVTAAFLYFHFQFLTDMAALAKANQPEGHLLAKRLLTQRTGYVSLCTFCVLYSQLFIRNDAGVFPSFLPTVALAVASLAVMLSLFRLRRLFMEQAAA